MSVALEKDKNSVPGAQVQVFKCCGKRYFSTNILCKFTCAPLLQNVKNGDAPIN